MFPKTYALGGMFQTHQMVQVLQVLAAPQTPAPPPEMVGYEGQELTDLASHVGHMEDDRNRQMSEVKLLDYCVEDLTHL